MDPYTCSVFGHMYLPYPTTVTSSVIPFVCVCYNTEKRPSPPKKILLTNPLAPYTWDTLHKFPDF